MKGFEIDRATLVEQIEAAFADSRTAKERGQYLHRLPIASAQALPYEVQELEALFRSRVWQSVVFEQRDLLHETDALAALSDEALAYFLPALLIMAVSDPGWLVNQEELEQRLIDCFGDMSGMRLLVVIAFVELMVGFYSHVISTQDALNDAHPLLDVEDLEYRLLLYLDEKRALVQKLEDAQRAAQSES